MINRWRTLIILPFMSSIFTEAVSTCSVQPTAVVVVVGEKVSLNCTATGVYVRSWQIGTDVQNKTVVYSAPVFGPNGTINRNQFVADGYFVTNGFGNKISLHINRTKLTQAGLYACNCWDDLLSGATTTVVVLALEPQFSVSSNFTNGKPVSLTCNISFNGSTDVSSHLTIKSLNGSTVDSIVCFSSNALTTLCNRKFLITANASVDQSYTCSVQLITNSTTIYSRILNTSLQWQRVFNVEIVVTNPNRCSAVKCIVGENITCETDGTLGITAFEWWQVPHNNSKSLLIGNDSQSLKLTTVGQFTYQCHAYNTIRGVKYRNISKTVTINVTEDTGHPRGRGLPIVSVIGVSVAIGIVAIVIAMVVTLILFSRKKKDAFRAISTQESSEAPPQRHIRNSYNKTPKVTNSTLQNSAAKTSSQPSVSNNKESHGTDVTVIDNVLYDGAHFSIPNSAVPSDGNSPEEAIYNEIRVFE